MNILTAMAEFQKLDDTIIGKGPMKKTDDATEMQKEIQAFAAQYRFSDRYPDYLEFVNHYAAAAIFHADESLILQIYGFDPDIAVHIDYPDEPIIEENFLRFAEISMKTDDTYDTFIGASYAFNISEQQEPGIYHRIIPAEANPPKIPYTWYCNSFLVWLKRCVETKGRLSLKL